MEALRRSGRATEAVALGDYVEGVLVHERLSWLRPALDMAWGDAERSHDRGAEALARYHDALVHELARSDPDPLRMLPAWQGQAEVLVAHGELDEAVAPLEAALDTTREALGPLHPAAIEVLQRLGQVQQRRGRLGEARPYLEQALELVREVQTHDPARVIELEAAVGSLLAAQDDHDRARAHFERAYQAAGGAAAAEGAAVFGLGLGLVREHRDAGDAPRAREVLDALLAPHRDAPYAADAVHDGDGTAPPSTAARVEAELLSATLAWDAGDHEAARAMASGIDARLHDTTAHQVYRDEVTRWLEEHPVS
jgi:tetratricopeptide (TPR) repeat protein